MGQTAHRQCGHLRHGLRAACAAGSGCPCRALAADASSAEKALTAFCRGARGQLFWDGNKRTSLMLANKILILGGAGIMTITDKYMEQFNGLLLDFYNTGESEALKEFLYNNAIQGITV